MSDALIPKELIEQQRRFAEIRTLIARLEKGKTMITDAIQKGELDKFPSYTTTYIEVMELSLKILENTHYYQEFLASGRTVLIRRRTNRGRDQRQEPEIESMYPDPSRVPYDPYQLAAILKLAEVFGEDAIEVADFEEPISEQA